jgi:hypothetical protein
MKNAQSRIYVFTAELYKKCQFKKDASHRRKQFLFFIENF